MPITETDMKRFCIDGVSSHRCYDFEVLDAERKLLKLMGVTIRHDLYDTGGADILPEALVRKLADDGWRVVTKDDDWTWDAYYKDEEWVTPEIDIIVEYDEVYTDEQPPEVLA